MAQAAGGTRTAGSAGGGYGLNGNGYRSPPVPLYVVAEVRRQQPPVPGWARLTRLLGRATVWSVPGYAIAVVAGAGRTGTAVTLAAVLAPLALLSVAGLLAGGRGGWLAAAGAGTGIAGGIVLLAATGTVFVPHHARPGGLAGAVLLAGGWLLLGLAVLYSRSSGAGDGVLLALSAVPLAVGGSSLDAWPRLGALLLLAAGIGLCRSALDPAQRRGLEYPGRGRGSAATWQRAAQAPRNRERRNREPRGSVASRKRDPGGAVEKLERGGAARQRRRVDPRQWRSRVDPRRWRPRTDPAARRSGTAAAPDGTAE
jgi:hypothetical protein